MHFEVSKVFHRGSVLLKRGYSTTSVVNFPNLDEAVAWANYINEKHKCIGYHISAIKRGDKTINLDVHDIRKQHLLY